MDDVVNEVKKPLETIEAPSKADEITWVSPSVYPDIQRALEFPKKFKELAKKVVIYNAILVFIFGFLMLGIATLEDNAKKRAKVQDDPGRPGPLLQQFEPRVSRSVFFANKNDFRFETIAPTEALEEFLSESKKEKGSKNDFSFRNLWDYSSYQLFIGAGNQEVNALSFIGKRLDKNQLSLSHYGLINYLQENYLEPCDAYFMREDFAKCRLLIAHAASILRIVQTSPEIVHNDVDKKWTNFQNLVLLLDALFERSDLLYLQNDRAWSLYQGVYARFTEIWNDIGKSRYQRELRRALLQNRSPLVWEWNVYIESDFKSQLNVSKDQYLDLVEKGATRIRENYIRDAIGKIAFSTKSADPACLSANAWASWSSIDQFSPEDSLQGLRNRVTRHVQSVKKVGGDSCDPASGRHVLTSDTGVTKESSPPFVLPATIQKVSDSPPPILLAQNFSSKEKALPPIPVLPSVSDGNSQSNSNVVVVPSLIPIPQVLFNAPRIRKVRVPNLFNHSELFADLVAYETLLKGIDALRERHFDTANNLFRQVSSTSNWKLANIGVLDQIRCSVLSAQATAQRKPNEPLTTDARGSIEKAKSTITRMRTQLTHGYYENDITYYLRELERLERNRDARHPMTNRGTP